MAIIINGDTGVSGVNGSAATPSYQGSTASTGVFFPATSTMAFSEGGVEAMRIDASGNLGIGTTVPSQKLDVSGNVNSTGTVVMSSPYTMRNKIINGAMQISQRGTTINSIGADGTYTADRWYVNRGGTINYSQATSNPPTGFQYYGSFINQTASNPFFSIIQAIETFNCYELLGQTVTFSVYLKAATNTVGSTTIALNIGYATTADTKLNATLTNQNFTISSSSWTRCVATFSIPSNALTISPIISLGTTAVNDGVFVTGAQLERGAVATPFEYRIYQQELAMCWRYFITYSDAAFTVGYDPNYATRNAGGFAFNMMRTTPTVTITGGGMVGHHGIAPTVLGGPWPSGVSFQFSGSAYRSSVSTSANWSGSLSAEL